MKNRVLGIIVLVSILLLVLPIVYLQLTYNPSGRPASIDSSILFFFLVIVNPAVLFFLLPSEIGRRLRKTGNNFDSKLGLTLYFYMLIPLLFILNGMILQTFEISKTTDYSLGVLLSIDLLLISVASLRLINSKS